MAGKYFRIGHLGDINDAMLMGALSSTEMALQLAGVPLKKGGAQAAMDYLVTAHGAAPSRRRSKSFGPLVPAQAGTQFLIRLDLPPTRA